MNFCATGPAAPLTARLFYFVIFSLDHWAPSQVSPL